ncbi:hypothetical protein Dsin_024552 [Dipteronia sinensis]|uniref:Reverse transcriptase zinc-binding domain-containing protein n=1 Tax=Dipteronia sinensis TaxID=43782 RepID=A0AAD9ZUP6_9ROSI|nr:hypothetical protein Dsin_024552 [Dipteronia sinensis]
MEVLSKILTKRIEDSPCFKFHWKCDKIKLSHLCFADDLIMLCHGSPSLALALKAALMCSSCFRASLLIKPRATSLLRLIISVLSSLQVFWASYLCLPIKILKIIERKFRSFLWKGVEGDSKGAKISWSDICLPKKEGGLGIKDLSSWNKALMIRHLWILIYAAMSIDLVEIRSRMPSYNPNSNIDDSIQWLPSSNGIYSTSFAFSSLRALHPLVPWFQLVWFPQNIPRMSFILWMTVRGRLSTRDRIHKYDPSAVTTCVLCNSHLESHAHLFFECLLSRAIWTQLLNYCGSPWNGLCWNDFITWASTHWRGNTPIIVAKKLCLGAAVYHIWRERNCRIFEGTQRTSLVVARSIIDTIRCQLLSINLRDHPLIALNWNVNAN